MTLIKKFFKDFSGPVDEIIAQIKLKAAESIGLKVDFQKALDILESWKKDKMISDDIALDEIIRDDPEASELVANLLERISELRD